MAEPIHRSRFPDVPIPAVTVPGLILAAADGFGDRPALVDAASGRTLTFAGVAGGARRVAAGLGARGFGRGDVLALVLPNVPEYPVAWLGAALAGGVVSTLNPLLTEQELAHLLADARARFVVTVPALLEKTRAAAARAGAEEVFVLGAADGAVPFAALATDGTAHPPPLDPATDLVSLPFSSGTSGRPKGVMLTHRNLVAQLVLFDAAARLPHGLTTLAVLPYFHIYGLALILLAGLWRGATQIVLPRFELDAFLDALARHRVQWAPLVPPIMIALAKHPAVADHDLSALEIVTSGAAPLGGEVEEAVQRRLGCRVTQGYGMTELAGASHIVPHDPAFGRSGSCGLTMPNCEVRIVDPESGRSLGAGERGELWIRGPIVMQGYLRQPEATAATLVEDGWLRTGDIGYADEDGYFFVVDRLKELIKYKGYQVAPADLEALLLTHPAVADAAVVPSPDPDAGEVPKAFVVLRHPVDQLEILAWVAGRVAPYEKIRLVEVVDAVPRSPSGKILRRVLVERERARVAAGGPTDG
jgi:acyl-CoA synthetase (AMP-forming)/AMP-acid ligase II